jgi:hypothetical protein
MLDLTRQLSNNVQHQSDSSCNISQSSPVPGILDGVAEERAIYDASVVCQ